MTKVLKDLKPSYLAKMRNKAKKKSKKRAGKTDKKLVKYKGKTYQEAPSYSWLVDKNAVDPTRIKAKTWERKEAALARKFNMWSGDDDYDKKMDKLLPLVGGSTRDELKTQTDVADLLFMATDMGSASDFLNTHDPDGGLNRMGREHLIAYYGEEAFDFKGFKKDFGFTMEHLMTYPDKHDEDTWESVMSAIRDGEYYEGAGILEKMIDGEAWDDEFLAGADNGKYDY